MTNLVKMAGSRLGEKMAGRRLGQTASARQYKTSNKQLECDRCTYRHHPLPNTVLSMGLERLD
jgi:hypothetical protein